MVSGWYSAPTFLQEVPVSVAEPESFTDPWHAARRVLPGALRLLPSLRVRLVALRRGRRVASRAGSSLPRDDRPTTVPVIRRTVLERQSEGVGEVRTFARSAFAWQKWSRKGYRGRQRHGPPK